MDESLTLPNGVCTYTVMVRATDPSGDSQMQTPQRPPTAATVMVVITVTDVNEAPEVTTDDATMTVRRGQRATSP